jgi:hypothetical protein
MQSEAVMSKKKLERIIRKIHREEHKRKLNLAMSKKRSKRDQSIRSGVSSAASLGVKIAAANAAATAATTATATAAAGGAAAATTATVAAGGAAAAGGGSIGAILAGTAVAAPPFSTAAAVVAGVGVAAFLGIRQVGKQRDKFLSHDAILLRKLIARYKKRKSKWRRKKIVRLLKQYDKHLSHGNKKTLAPWDGAKRNRHELDWKAKKARIEMKLKALYAAQYAKSYRKLMKGIKPKKIKISKKQARAEKIVVKNIKRKQAESIDPRTSVFPLLAPGKVGITPKLAAADALQDQQSDTAIIKLAKLDPSASKRTMARIPNPEKQYQQAIKLLKAPEKDLPKELQKPKNPNKGIIIGATVVGSLALLGSGYLIYQNSKENQ